MSQVQIHNSDHCIWRARINHLCKSGLDPIDCKSSFFFSSIEKFGVTSKVCLNHYLYILYICNTTLDRHDRRGSSPEKRYWIISCKWQTLKLNTKNNLENNQEKSVLFFNFLICWEDPWIMFSPEIKSEILSLSQ